MADPVVVDEDEAGIIMWYGGLRTLLGHWRDLAQRSTQTYAIVWDRCSPTMKGKLGRLGIYKAVNVAKNPVQLLQELCNIICGREFHK